MPRIKPLRPSDASGTQKLSSFLVNANEPTDALFLQQCLLSWSTSTTVNISRWTHCRTCHDSPTFNCKMNRTIKVTGFSLKPAIRQKLRDLFSSVAQVQKIYLSPDRDWYFGNESLRIRPAVPPREIAPIRSQRQPVFGSPVLRRPTWNDDAQLLCSENSTSDYQEFRETQNKFWIDVPHERCCMVLPRKKKPKTRRLDTVGPASTREKVARKAKKKKKKKRAYLESAASLPFGSSPDPVTFTEEAVSCRQIFIKSTSSISVSLPLSSTADDVYRLVSKETKLPPEVIHLTVDGRTLSDEIVRSIVPGSTLRCSVKGLGGSDVDNTLLLPFGLIIIFIFIYSAKQMFWTRKPRFEFDVKIKDKKPVQQEEAKSPDTTKDEAPAQLSKSARKRLRKKNGKQAAKAGTPDPDNNSCPADTGDREPDRTEKSPEDEIYKGLPSKASSDSTEEAGNQPVRQSLEDNQAAEDRPSHRMLAQGALLKDADANQVQKWLQHICHVSPENLKQFDCMNGKTLHEYNDFESLLLDVDISYGKARTIIFRRDFPDEQSALLQWTTEDVKTFVRTKLEKPDLDLSSFNEKEVDGVVLLSFGDGGELKRDLGLNGIAARRIISERDTFIASEAAQAKRFAVVKNQAGNENENGQSKIIDLYLGKQDLNGLHMLFLQNSLHLQCLNLPGDSHIKSLKQCSLDILRVKEMNPSLLDKSFVFFILTVPGLPKKSMPQIWTMIRNRTCDLWMKSLKMHLSDPNRLEVEGVKLLLDGTELIFSKTPTPSFITLSDYEKDVGKRYDQYQTQVLLIDRQLLTAKKDAPPRSGYSCKLGGKKDSAYYHFGFEKDRLYLSFDSEDFASDIQKSKIPDLKIGVAERCQLHLQPAEDVAKKVEAVTASASGAGCESIPVRSREFKQDPGSCKIYEEGKILDVLESAHGRIHRSVEIKYYVPDDDRKREMFLLKSLKFVCGCLNSRRNGTIYFGVPEKSVGEKEFQYGEIVGVYLQKKEQEKYYESLRKHLGRCFPSSNNTVELCVHGPFFVRIKTVDGTTCSEKCIIELDVEPCSDICKDRYFEFDASKVGKHLAQDSGVYLRDTGGDGTVQTRRLQPQDKERFVSDDLPTFAEQRQKEETSWEYQQKLRIKSEASKLARFMENCDDSVCPILVVSEPTEEVKKSIQNNLKFVKFIPWVAVFDFDYNSAHNGLFHMYQNQTCLKEAKDFAVTEFVGKTAGKLKEELQMSAHVLWLFANGNSARSTFEKLDKRDWFRKYYPHVKDAINFLQNPCVISRQRHHVLILVSAEMEDDIVRTVDDIASCSNIGLGSVFLVFDQEYTQKVFVDKSSHSEDIVERSAILPWQDAQRVVDGLLDLEQKDKHKSVVTANGSVAQIPPHQWMTWTDLTILSENECDESNLTLLSSKANQEEIRFYRGGQVSWFNFFFPNQVMERSIQHRIEAEITLLSQKAVSNTNIPKVLIYHMPGTGGTTLAKHILWKLKTLFKCAVIERLTQDTFRQICEFWEAGEHDDLKEDWKPVLLVSDNNTSEDVDMTESALCDLLFRRQKFDRLSRPIAVLIVCRRSVRHGSDGFSFSLKQKLSDRKEKMWMEQTYHRLEGKVLRSQINSFLGFLSMRHEFDMKKLERIIVPYLLDEGLSEHERDLIVYIALIMKYFPPSMGRPGIPVSSCDLLLNQNQKPWDKNVSDVANVILVREQNPVIETKVVRIANIAIAEVILRTVQERENLSLAEVVMNCLYSSLVADLDQCESYGSSLSIQIIRRMLLERFTATGEKGTMSPLILDILSKSGLLKAVEILELGHQQLGGEVFYQQMARLYTDQKEFENAVTSARKAVDLCLRTDKAELFHTLGHVYMKYFQHLIRSKTSCPPAVEHYTKELTVAVDSFKTLSEAQGSNDAITKSYACCDKIKLINLLLKRIIETILLPDDYSKFGRFLTEESYEMREFDVFPELKEIVKQSFETGIDILRFMYNFGFSYKTGKIDYARQKRSNFPVSYTKLECVRQFNMLAKTMKTTIKYRPGDDQVTESSMRIENHKLTGSFFESILFIVSSSNEVAYGSKQKREQCFEKLQKIKANLDLIDDYKKTTEDMDNYITVCLAMALVDKDKSGRYFASERSKMYRFCEKIISVNNDEVRTMRAHLYRVLICWPTWKAGKVYSMQHFRVSFHNKSTPLKCRESPLCPLVHFFIGKQSADFHLCHWTEIFDHGKNMFSWRRDVDDNEIGEEDVEEEITTAMCHKLQPFRGYYKAKDGSSQYVVEFNISNYSDEFQEPLTIRALRGEKIYRDAEVLFFLGFTLHGPVAYLDRVL